MILDRRKFLTAMLTAAVVAPAVVRASSLMPVRAIAPLELTPPDEFIGVYWGSRPLALAESFTPIKEIVAAQVLHRGDPVTRRIAETNDLRQLFLPDNSILWFDPRIEDDEIAIDTDEPSR